MEETQLTADSPDSFSVVIKCYDGKKFSVLVSLDDTVRDLKSKLNAQDSSLTPETGRLYYNDTLMEDDRTLRHYQITPNCSLNRSLVFQGDDGEAEECILREYVQLLPVEDVTEVLKFPEIDSRPQCQILECITEPYSVVEEEGTAGAAGSYLEESSHTLNQGSSLQRQSESIRKLLVQAAQVQGGDEGPVQQESSGWLSRFQFLRKYLSRPLETKRDPLRKEVLNIESLGQKLRMAGDELKAAAVGSHLEEISHTLKQGSSLQRQGQSIRKEPVQAAQVQGGGEGPVQQESSEMVISSPVGVPMEHQTEPLQGTGKAGEEGMAAAVGSHLEESSHTLNQRSRLQRRCQHCTQEDLPQVMPEITQDLVKHRTTYQAHVPAAGLFQCRITGLGFKVKSAVTITYRYTSWTRHLSKADQELWVPAGPLFDIEAQPELVQAVYLPHFICLAEAVDTSLCSIAHFKSGIMTLEKPTSLVAFSAVLENPSFSLLGVLWRRLRSTFHSFPAHSLVLIFQLLGAANTTLHLYLIPDDNSVKQAIERQESSWNSKVIPKPSPVSPLFFGCDYWVTSNNSVVITPEPRLPFCYKSPKEQQPFLELYIKNMAEEMELRMMDKRDDTVVWKASLRSGDVNLPARFSRSSSGAAFIKRHKTELCCRMSQISAILLHLRDANVINSDEEEEVQVQRTRKSKNRTLLEMVEKKGVEAQEQLYQILQEKDPYLIGHLEMS